MIELHTYIYLLLAIAAGGLYYVFKVIKRQLELFKREAQTKEIGHFRRVLFYLSMVITIFALIPISINVFSLFHDTNRPPHVPWISVVYSLSVHIQSLLLSYLLWRLYRLASDNDN